MKVPTTSVMLAWLFLLLVGGAGARSLMLGFREGIGWGSVAAGVVGGLSSVLFQYLLTKRRSPTATPSGETRG